VVGVAQEAQELRRLAHVAEIGLPEAVPGTRNFDYRYVWMRDASFTVTAFVNLG
jgi:GH15 family glucan-1,4-alpha-glucosidase